MDGVSALGYRLGLRSNIHELHPFLPELVFARLDLLGKDAQASHAKLGIGTLGEARFHVRGSHGQVNQIRRETLGELRPDDFGRIAVNKFLISPSHRVTELSRRGDIGPKPYKLPVVQRGRTVVNQDGAVHRCDIRCKIRRELFKTVTV